MRRRWRWMWKMETEVLGFVWFVFWTLVLVGVGATTHKGSWWWLDTVNVGILMGPFVLFGVWHSVRGLWSGARWLRAHPPIRREWESVEDMRQVHRREP